MLFRLILLFGSISLFFSCASISPPTGGAKDEIPPKLLRSIPKKGELNYQSKEIHLTFNEYIVLNNLNDQLIINPPIEGNYEAVVRKNRLTLIFNQNLKPNTTYTLNFRQGVKDITEGNINSDLKLAFSTGNVLDTFKIKGTVKDLLTNISSENILVSLYKTKDTSTITKHKPLYFTKTDKNGSFLIENIKLDDYAIYAFKDNNGNLYYDNETELIDYDSISLKKDTLLDFLISKHYNLPPKINKTTSTERMVTLTFSKGLVDGYAKGLLIKDSLYYNIEGNQLKVYNTFNNIDSIPLYVHVKDSANNILKDTVQIGFTKEKGKQKEKTAKNNSFTLSPIITDRRLVSPVDSLTFAYNLPLKPISYNAMTIKIDSNLSHKLNNQHVNQKKDKNLLTIRRRIAFRDSVIVDINKGAVLSIFGDTLPRQKFIFIPKNESEYAILGGQVSSKKKNTLLQLLNDKYQIIDQIATSDAFKFDYVPPGTYYLRVVVDKNRNNSWDPGNFKNSVQPEQIYFYKEKVELRANWEITDLIFKF